MRPTRMSTDVIALESREPRRSGWLHGMGIDLLILAGPWLFLLALLVADAETRVAVWMAQFVWGNTTHVVLTFLLLASRRDILRATPTQARLVIVASLATFALSYAAMKGVKRVAPTWVSFPMAVMLIFGIHHRLSQARGIWSLYNLRAATLGAPPPSDAERKLQGSWTALGLLLVCVGWLFVPTAQGRMFSPTQPIPGMEAPLPYETAYGLAAVWIAFSLVVARTLVRGGAGVPKLAHVGTHALAVTSAILFPIWGGVVWCSIHGLEYYFLCARMMRPRDGDAEGGTPAWLVWPLMALAMAPLAAVGLAHSPFIAVPPSPVFEEALHVMNALVIAHYCADAFIYRFRIPGVRKVALHRLGFG